MSRTWWIALVALAGTPLAVPGQEYAIKLARPGPGDQFQVKTDNHTEVDIKALDAGGTAVFEKKELKSHQFMFREIGLERGPAGGDLVKLKRIYKKAQRTVDGDRRTLPFQGETLLIDKKEGASTFQIEGGEVVEGNDAKELAEEFNKGGIGKLIEVFLPKMAVKVNDVWKLDVGLVAKEFMKDGKAEFDPAKSTGSGKLLKAYQKDGRQFGVVELTVTLAVTKLTNEDGTMIKTKDSKFVITVERDGAIDGSLSATELHVRFDGDIRGEINANGMDLNLELTVRAKAEEQRSPVAK
jgi:hypothetical protein